MIEALWSGMLLVDLRKVVEPRPIDTILHGAEGRNIILFRDWWTVEHPEPFTHWVSGAGAFEQISPERYMLVAGRETWLVERANGTTEEEQDARDARRTTVVQRRDYLAAFERLAAAFPGWDAGPWLARLQQEPLYLPTEMADRPVALLRQLGEFGQVIDAIALAPGDGATLTGISGSLATALEQWMEGGSDPTTFLAEVVDSNRLGERFGPVLSEFSSRSLRTVLDD